MVRTYKSWDVEDSETKVGIHEFNLTQLENAIKTLGNALESGKTSQGDI